MQFMLSASALALVGVFLTGGVNADNHASADTIVSLTYETMPYNFTLSAWNSVLPNSNNTGVPLVYGESVSTGRYIGRATVTWATYNDPEAETKNMYMGLNDGKLTGLSAPKGNNPTLGHWTYSASQPVIGKKLEWVSGDKNHRGNFGLPDEEGAYSIIASTGYPYPRLAANGRTDLWWLCAPEAIKNDRLKQASVYYNIRGPEGDKELMDITKCHEVELFVHAARQ